MAAVTMLRYRGGTYWTQNNTRTTISAGKFLSRKYVIKISAHVVSSSKFTERPDESITKLIFKRNDFSYRRRRKRLVFIYLFIFFITSFIVKYKSTVFGVHYSCTTDGIKPEPDS